MQQPRKTLTARLARTEDLTGPLADLPPMIVEAITRKICIAVVYNKTPMTLAPQIAYTKHDDLFIDAVVVEREGKPPKEVKLSTFKLAGLSGISLTPQSFTANTVFDPANPKYEGPTLSVAKA